MQTNIEFEITQTEYGKVLVPRSSWDQSYLSILKREHCVGFYLNVAFGCEVDDLNVLASLRGLRYLQIVQDYELIGLSSIDATSLRCMSFNRPPERPYDLSQFQYLEYIGIDLQGKSRGIENLKRLQFCNLSNPPITILRNLFQCSNLRKLFLIFCNISELTGIERFQHLTDFELRMGRHLGTLHGLEKCQSLKNVVFEGLKHVNKIDELGMLPNLETVGLINCGHIKSLLPLLNCPKLHRVIVGGNSVIDDGKIAALFAMESLKDFRCLPRRHYDALTSPSGKFLRP